MPERLQLAGDTVMSWAVPKFHLPAHKPECHGPFALNYMHGVGRTDDEGVERNWAWLNGAAPSTSQMGPGSRHDTLDDFIGFSNFRKTVDYGDTLLRKMVQAIPDAIMHHQAFEAFTHGLRNEHARKLVEWEHDIREWERDKTRKDTYLIEEEFVSVHEIECRLAEEDHRQSSTVSGEVGPSVFVIGGLALEGNQFLLRTEAAKRDQTAHQLSSLQRKQNALCQKIRRFHEAQVSYFPGLPAVDYTSLPAEQLPLRLPSSLSPEQQMHAGELASIEDRLREAHAGQALADLRRQLRLRTLSLRFKDDNATSQGSYTRMCALLDQIEAKIRVARICYNAARQAMLSLRGPGPWEVMFQVLKSEDVRGINERCVVAEDNEANHHAEAMSNGTEVIQIISTLRLQTGEGHRAASWIWYTATVDETNDGTLHDGIRLEWLKSRARDQRWREELLLLEEEMRR
ncbi:hypothetical protein H0H92_010276, partial [Tricholoma furcatifolium]